MTPATLNLSIRPASLADLPELTRIHKYYVSHTHITFDVDPFTPGERLAWFHEHCDGKRYRILVAERPEEASPDTRPQDAFVPKRPMKPRWKRVSLAPRRTLDGASAHCFIKSCSSCSHRRTARR